MCRDNLNKDALMTLYYSLVYSNLIYCISIWGGTLHKHTSILFSAQKRTVRAISFMKKMDSISNKLLELKMLNLHHIYKLFCALLIFKFRNFGYCKSIYSRLHHNHATRGVNNNMIIPLARTSWFSKSVIVNPPKIWNNLPRRLKIINNLHSFKLNLKKCLLNCQANP